MGNDFSKKFGISVIAINAIIFLFFTYNMIFVIKTYNITIVAIEILLLFDLIISVYIYFRIDRIYNEIFLKYKDNKSLKNLILDKNNFIPYELVVPEDADKYLEKYAERSK